MAGDNGEEPKELTVEEKLALEPVGRAPEPHEIELISFIKADLTEALKLMNWETTPAALIKAMFLPSLWAVVFYRISSWAYFRSRLLLPISALFFWLNIVLFGCEISGTARIGKGFVIAHTVGVGIGSDVEIGERFRIMKGATIGSTGRFLDRDPGMPTIGDDVWLLFSAAIGGKVTIGRCGGRLVHPAPLLRAGQHDQQGDDRPGSRPARVAAAGPDARRHLGLAQLPDHLRSPQGRFRDPHIVLSSLVSPRRRSAL